MRLSWDDIGERLYRDGVDHGALYIMRESGYDVGVSWNGLTGVDDSTSGREITSLYTKDVRSKILKTKPERGGTIKCFTYPPEFEECIGGNEVYEGLVVYDQDELSFGFSFRNVLGNDIDGLDHGYITNIYYGAHITSATMNSATLDSNMDVEEMSFGFTSIPEEIDDYSPISFLSLRSDRLYDVQWKKLEDTLYGTDTSDPYLPTPDDLIRMLEVVIISGNVIWDDENDDQFRPDHLNISLYGEVNGVRSLATVIKVYAKDNWNFTFDPQFKYSGEDEIAFSVSGAYGEEIIAETNENLVSEGPVFKFVTEEYWPCHYDETVNGFVLTETRADDPLE